MIFSDGPDHAIWRKISNNLSPCSTRVSRLEQIRFEVRCLMILNGYVGCIRLVTGSDDATHIRQVRHAWKLINLAPILATILSYLQQAVIRSNVNQPFLLL